jgi:AraC-like DNA-binding protein
MMSAIFESRLSDSPYIEIIWRGRVEQDYSPVCPADVRWNLLFTRYHDQVRVSAEGATSQFVPKNQFEGAEFLVIKFKLGVYMPFLPAGDLLNGDAVLPDASGQKFWLNGAAWEFPDFDNVEAFVDRMVREGDLAVEPVVKAALQHHPTDVSSRTVRRRFLYTTGLTPTTIQQIERAKQAAALLQQGVPILDAVYEAGYADQPHMTRSLRRFMGQTPAQIARME